MITRRQMLARLLGGSVALAAADIWIPGKRTISLPNGTDGFLPRVDVQWSNRDIGGPCSAKQIYDDIVRLYMQLKAQNVLGPYQLYGPRGMRARIA